MLQHVGTPCLCQSSSPPSASASLHVLHQVPGTLHEPQHALWRWRKARSRPSAQLPGHLHVQAPSLLCPLDVALSRLPATPRCLQVSRATFRRPALPGCPVRPSTSLSPCLPGFSPGAARRMHVSDRLLLHFLSAVEVLLNFLFSLKGTFSGVMMAERLPDTMIQGGGE